MADGRTIGVGIIGAGFARITQIPGFRDCMGAKVVAIASKNPENAAKVAQEFAIDHVDRDWRDLVKRDDVDLVSIVTPPSTHYEMTLAALDQGKAVLCEKPMAMNAEEAREMRDRAKQVNVLALIDHELRFLNSRQLMRSMLHNGAIGAVRHCEYLFRADSRGTAERAWDWWSDEGMGGGTLGAIGSHVIDSFRWMLNSEVAEVSAMLTSHVPQRLDSTTGEMRAVTSDDAAKLHLRFVDSTLTQNTTGAALLSLVESGTPENSLQIFGTEGALRVQETGELWRSRAGSGTWRPCEVLQDPLAPGMQPVSWSRGFAVFACKIIEALRNGATTVKDASSFEDGYRVQLVLDACRASHQSRCWTRTSDPQSNAE